MERIYLRILFAIVLPLMSGLLSSGHAIVDGSNSRASIEKNAGNTVLDRDFKIKLGQEVTVRGQDLKIKFASVPEDSRCPKDVTCVWAGDARILINVRRAKAKALNIELHTNGQFAQTGKYQQYLIKLVALDPYPKTSNRAKPINYVATLMIKKE